MKASNLHYSVKASNSLITRCMLALCTQLSTHCPALPAQRCRSQWTPCHTAQSRSTRKNGFTHVTLTVGDWNDQVEHCYVKSCLWLKSHFISSYTIQLMYTYMKFIACPNYTGLALYGAHVHVPTWVSWELMAVVKYSLMLLRMDWAAVCLGKLFLVKEDEIKMASLGNHCPSLTTQHFSLGQLQLARQLPQEKQDTQWKPFQVGRGPSLEGPYEGGCLENSTGRHWADKLLGYHQGVATRMAGWGSPSLSMFQ